VTIRCEWCGDQFAGLAEYEIHVRVRGDDRGITLPKAAVPLAASGG